MRNLTPLMMILAACTPGTPTSEPLMTTDTSTGGSQTNFVPDTGEVAGGSASQAEAWKSTRPLTPGEWEEARRLKPPPVASAQGAPRFDDASRTEAALREARQMAPEAVVKLLVELVDVDFDMTRFQGADADKRRRLIDERREQLAPQRELATARVRRAGGKVVGHLWLGGSGLIVEAPAHAAPAIAALAGVRYIEVQREAGEPAASYDLGQVRSGTLASGLISAGYDANGGNRVTPSGPVRLGIIEHDSGVADNFLATNHVGYLDAAGGTNRVRAVYRCTSVSCATTAASATTATHGQRVTGVAAGSIEQGQDAAWPGGGTTAQKARSGPAKEAEIYYYSIDSTGASIRLALERALRDGVDIVNMSFGYGSCNPTEDWGGSNAAFRAAMQGGILPVAASGNGATSLTEACGVKWPATRPEVLSAVGLRTDPNTTAYTDLNLGISCAAKLGGLAITSHNGTASTATVLGLAAPGYLTNMLGAPPASYSSGCGSSFASPVVAGSAALLLDAMQQLGWYAANNPARLYNNMLLLGDAWDGQNVSAPGGSVQLATRPSRLSGFGRLRMRTPDGVNMQGPWHWYDTMATVHQGSVVTIDINGAGAEPAGITELKIVASWFPTDFADVADVDVEVVDACNNNTVLASQTDYDYHNRIRLSGATAGGRCVQVRLKGFAVPPSGQTVYLSALYHGGAI